MALALGFGWLDWRSTRRRAEGLRAPIVASRDLPPLPRSPEPLPDEALVFARRAAHAAPRHDDTPVEGPALSIAEGVDLRAMLSRVMEASRRREPRDQTAQARARIVERLSAGKQGLGNGTTLQLVKGQRLATAPETDTRRDDDADRIDLAMKEALTSALGTLRQLSDLSRG